jgi:hypothetical protein
MGETPQRLAKEASLLNLFRGCPGHDQQRRRVVGAYSRQGEQLRGDLCHQPIELDVQLGYLLGEGPVTAGHRTERKLGCRLWCFGPSAWT